MKRLSWLAAVAGVLLILVFAQREKSNDPSSSTPSKPLARVNPQVSNDLVPNPAAQRFASEFDAEAGDPSQDVIILHQLITMYISALGNRQGSPIGNDTDLARALAGLNPMRQYFLPPNHPSLAIPKHIIDRWGSPYFIHPWGHNAYEIRSAGPDRKLFSADDLVANAPPQQR